MARSRVLSQSTKGNSDTEPPSNALFASCEPKLKQKAPASNRCIGQKIKLNFGDNTITISARTSQQETEVTNSTKKQETIVSYNM